MEGIVSKCLKTKFAPFFFEVHTGCIIYDRISFKVRTTLYVPVMFTLMALTLEFASTYATQGLDRAARRRVRRGGEALAGTLASCAV